MIIDTFKKQHNDAITNLFTDNNYVIVIVSHNLTNKFQPLEIMINQPAKCFIRDFRPLLCGILK